MIPKVVFVNSSVYNDVLRQLSQNPNYPTNREIESYMHDMSIHWKKYEKKILTEISNVLKLKYKESVTKCYITGRSRTFSDPLTISMWPQTPMDFISTVAHEMIHQLFIQNTSVFKDVHKFMHGKYNNESSDTISHIALHAVLNHVYLKIFHKEWVDRDIHVSSIHPDYTRAWEIVQKEGYEKVIKEFVKLLKR